MTVSGHYNRLQNSVMELTRQSEQLSRQKIVTLSLKGGKYHQDPSLNSLSVMSMQEYVHNKSQGNLQRVDNPYEIIQREKIEKEKAARAQQKMMLMNDSIYSQGRPTSTMTSFLPSVDKMTKASSKPGQKSYQNLRQSLEALAPKSRVLAAANSKGLFERCSLQGHSTSIRFSQKTFDARDSLVDSNRSPRPILRNSHSFAKILTKK